MSPKHCLDHQLPRLEQNREKMVNFTGFAKKKMSLKPEIKEILSSLVYASVLRISNLKND